jgi:tetratricopeptide (TPR) repeat protein
MTELGTTARFPIDLNPDRKPSEPVAPSKAKIEGRDTIAESYVELLARNARLLFENGQIDLAQNLATEILRLRPYDTSAIRMMGQCFSKLGDFELAVRCFQSATKIEGSSQNYFFLAESLYELGALDQAHQAYSESLDRMEGEESTLFEIFKKLGNIAVRKSDFDAAEDFYNRAFAINPESDILLVNYGTLEVQRGNWEAAKCRFQDAITINQACDRAWIGLAVAFKATGDSEMAFANIQRAMDINTINSSGIRLYAEWAIEVGRPHDAITRLETYFSKVQEDMDVMPLFIVALLTVGRKNQALIEYDRLCLSRPDHADIPNLKVLLHPSRQTSKASD